MLSCPKGLGSPFEGGTPFIFFISTKELSIFVDEAGVLGPIKERSLLRPFVCVS